MPLDKQTVSVSFAGGVDTKTDPYQIPLGKLSALINGRLVTAKSVRKRYGSRKLSQNIAGSSAAISSAKAIYSFENELLLADGSNLYSYSEVDESWVNKGTFKPLDLTTSAVSRAQFNMDSPGSAYHSAGFYLFTWREASGGVYACVTEAATGQMRVAPFQLSATGFYPSAFALGSYLVATYMETSNNSFVFRTFPITNPSGGSTITISNAVYSGSIKYDALVIGPNLAVAYNDSGSSSLVMRLISETLTVGSAFGPGAGYAQNSIAIFGDTSYNNWLAYYDGTDIQCYIYSQAQSQVLGKTTIVPQIAVQNITGIVSGTTASIFYDEELQTLTNPVVYTAQINSVSLTSAGSVGSISTIAHDVGLASKAFNVNGVSGVLSAHISTLQPSYFLLSSSGQVLSRFAQGNAGSYDSGTVLPTVNEISSTQFQLPYLYADLLTTVSGTPLDVLGLNSALFNTEPDEYPSLEIGKNLLLGGACPRIYDGTNLVEQGFNLYPETPSVALHTSALTFTGNLTSGSAVITNVSSLQGLILHQVITGTGVPSNTIITAFISPTEIEISQNATATSTGATLSVGGALGVGASTASTNQFGIGALYQWLDAQGNVHKSSPTPDPYFIQLSQSQFAQITMSLSVFSNGANWLAVTSLPAGLAPGQTLSTTSSTYGTLPSGTYITDIGLTRPDNGSSAYVLYLSNTYTDLQSAATLQTYDTGYLLIGVRSLPLTDKNSVQMPIFRTANNGSTYYKATSATLPPISAPGTTLSIPITVGDGLLVGNEILYTEGGVVDNIPAPALGSLSVYQARAVGISLEDRTQVWYSKQVVPGSPVEFNDQFYIQLDTRGGLDASAVMGMDDKLVIAKETTAFYTPGQGPDATGSSNDFVSPPYFITADSGCVDPGSLVLMPEGLMFKSLKGIYLLGRDLSVRYIGAPVEKFNSSHVLKSLLILDANEVRFVLDSGVTLIYDYFFDQWGWDTTPSPVNAALWQNAYTYCTADGRVYQENSGTFMDGDLPIALGLVTGFISFQSLQDFQRVYKLKVLGHYISPHKLQVGLAYDFSPAFSQQTLFDATSINAQTTYGSDSPYGQESTYGGPIPLDDYQVFPKRQLCESIQVALQEIPIAPYGEGLQLSGLAFEVGIKRGLYKLPASRSGG